MKKCSCICAPQYHRDDCSFFDTYGNPKNKTFSNTCDEYKYVQNIYPDHLILFQIGDFYEFYEFNKKIPSTLFFKVVADLDMRYIVKNKNQNDSPFMAGFPVISLEKYLNKLTSLNYNKIIYTKPYLKNCKERIYLNQDGKEIIKFPIYK